jgi:hypothetical protein
LQHRAQLVSALNVSKFQIKKSDKIAIWRAWDGFCYICRQPLDYFELEIDHVVPEVLDERPEELRAFREKSRIDESFPGFQINDFCNFAPAHRPCNGSKTDYYAPWTMICLEWVRDKLPKVREEQRKLQRKRKQNKALADLDAALESGDVTEDQVQELLDSRVPQIEDPLVFTFGLAIEDLNRNLKFHNHGLSYPALCDWLEHDLQKHLAEIINTPFHYSEPSQRTGETLSVRIVFPELDAKALSRFSRSWWTIYEPLPFRILYQTAYRREFPPARKVVLQTPVTVTLTKEQTADMSDEDLRKYARFTVLGYELRDETEYHREMAERLEQKFPTHQRMTIQQIEEQHFASVGGTIMIRNGEGTEEKLDYHDYQTLVGTEGEFADVNPVNWEPYAMDLLDWYNNTPPGEEEQFKPDE